MFLAGVMAMVTAVVPTNASVDVDIGRRDDHDDGAASCSKPI